MSDYFKSIPEKRESTHTYQQVDCGGICGNCIALVVDGEIVKGPPFHLNCACELKQTQIENAPIHKSNLCNIIAQNTNCNPQDILWLKQSLHDLGFYIPDKRADESDDKLNPYPNTNLFDSINNFQTKYKISEHGIVKPGYQTEIKIIQELEEQNKAKGTKMSDDGINWLKDKENKVSDKQGKHIIYDDQTGKPINTNEPLPKGATIGYGHLIKQGEDFRNGINEKTATELLCTDIAVAERAVRDNITVPLTQNQFDALTSLAYNIGAKNFANSTVVKYINNPNFHSSVYPNLESAWKAWNRSQGQISNGLIKRRQNEWDMYNRSIY